MAQLKPVAKDMLYALVNWQIVDLAAGAGWHFDSRKKSTLLQSNCCYAYLRASRHGQIEANRESGKFIIGIIIILNMSYYT